MMEQPEQKKRDICDVLSIQEVIINEVSHSIMAIKLNRLSPEAVLFNIDAMGRVTVTTWREKHLDTIIQALTTARDKMKGCKK